MSTAPVDSAGPPLALRPRSRRRSGRRTPLTVVSALAVALFIAAGAFAGVVGGTAPASAAARVSVSGTPALEGESQLSLSGTGFQSVQNGFGGVYVLFGWVNESGGWRPSEGGKTGEDYRYVYDDESNPTGYQLFVAFPGSSTGSAANGGELAADGTWSGTIRIPGARFTTYDRAQNETTVDCTEVQCGIITVGAHGVANAGNETFTPIEFAGSGSGGADDARGSDEEGQDAEAADDTADTPEAGEGAAATSGSAGSGAEAASAAPAASTSAIDPQLIANQQRQQQLLTLLVAVGIVLALCVMALSFGIGGYLAMKALLLGVNPEALEKVRQKREERAVRAEHRRRRRVSDLRRREEIRSQRAEARNEGRKDRTAIEHGAAHTGSPAAADAHTDLWISTESAATAHGPSDTTGASSTNGAGTYGAGSDALLRFFEDDGQSSASQKQNSPTVVLDRVEDTGDDRQDGHGGLA